MAALTKSVGLRSEVRVDDRSYWLTRVASLSASLAIPLVYPRMFALHNLPSKVALSFIHLEDWASSFCSTLDTSNCHHLPVGILISEDIE